MVDMNQAAQTVVNVTQNQNNSPKGGRESGPGRLSEEAKRDIAAQLRQKAQQTTQGK